jgi:hypothetical protein
LAKFMLNAKPSFLYFSKYNIISFTSFIVTPVHVDLECNFLRYIIVLDWIKPNKHQDPSQWEEDKSHDKWPQADTMSTCRDEESPIVPNVPPNVFAGTLPLKGTREQSIITNRLHKTAYQHELRLSSLNHQFYYYKYKS